MNNLYRKNPIFVQNRFNRFHHFSIGFTQLSNLFQPLAILFNQCLAYYGLCHCFFTGFQELFQSIATMGCHQLFNLFHQFQHRLSLVSISWFIGTKRSKEVLYSTMHFQGLDLTSYPLGMIL